MQLQLISDVCHLLAFVSKKETKNEPAPEINLNKMAYLNPEINTKNFRFSNALVH